MHVFSQQNFMRFIASIVIGVGLGHSSSAQENSYAQKHAEQFNTEADLWLDTIFGYCMDRVAGQAEDGYPANLSDGWTPMREDAQMTLGLKLFKPMESPKTRFTIVDLSPSGTSCWTQHSAPSAEIAATKFDALIKGPLSDRVKVMKSGKSKSGAFIRFFEYYPEGGTKPITIYQARSYRPQVSSFVTIVQRPKPDT